MLANFADNIFAIGQSRYETSHRYIKHIKQRARPRCSMTRRTCRAFGWEKRDGNFLSFSFIGWREEAVHLSRKFDSYRLNRADEMKRLADRGLSQRQIAERCQTSLASVNRFLQMWSPYDEEKKQIQIEIEQQHERERLEAIRDKRRQKERRASGGRGQDRGRARTTRASKGNGCFRHTVRRRARPQKRLRS